ncbi:DNA damage-regulated autophagy modulator protein 1 isoform X1 [Thamnophis elegans]|uniref:DNA damage-regulated autophagy modulator protein 1 isoform X1 n=1 Tax=Thamnophis elegans TaxID=35005 RepID=UPI001379043F|nr:DNA damage-regulated autophagy modulator protein 1 isoform X1 [Thamnophis elegans]
MTSGAWRFLATPMSWRGLSAARPAGGERQPLFPRGDRWSCRMFSFAQGVAFIPTFLVSWSSAAFILSYAIAVLSGHVEPLFPYISDTGAKPPESGIFGFMINVSAFLGAVTMYIKYSIVKKQNDVTHFISPCFNLLTLYVGILGCIGLGIVASFQELAVPAVHDGGALLAFVSGALYILLQTIISYKSRPRWSTPCVCHTRLFLSIMTWVAVIPMIACASLISITKIDWNPGEKDYVYHFVSAICEWTVAFGFVFFFLTYIRDFQEVTIQISTEIRGDL